MKLTIVIVNTRILGTKDRLQNTRTPTRMYEQGGRIKFGVEE